MGSWNRGHGSRSRISVGLDREILDMGFVLGLFDSGVAQCAPIKPRVSILQAPRAETRASTDVLDPPGNEFASRFGLAAGGLKILPFCMLNILVWPRSDLLSRLGLAAGRPVFRAWRSM